MLPDDREMLLAAMESVAEGTDRADAARSVLQAARAGLAFDWGVVLQFTRDRESGVDGAEAITAYPSGMAGVERGVRWAPLDAAERRLLLSGEPAIEAALARQFDDRSPLARLPAFGMTSRLQIPVFSGGVVRGCVSVYAARPNAFTPEDGIRLERVARVLHPYLASTPRAEAVAPGTRPRMAPAAGSRPLVPAPLPAPSNLAPSERDSPDVAAIDRTRLDALGEAISGVAHELNNPLTAILGYAQILPALEGGDRDQALGTIEQEALRASRIVRNLLTFARQRHPSFGPVALDSVLQRIVDAHRQHLWDDHVVIETRFAGGPVVEGDEGQLEQVFLTLVDNAHRAMMPQGGTLTLSTDVRGERVRAAIADTGPGVPPEIADRIFEPFFTTRELGTGVGLGLALVYGIVTEHRGRVWVEPAPSGGARFVVELPRPSGADAGQAGALESDPP